MLPIEIPDIPEARAEIVPARLARKMAPLFGMAWTEGPFGHRSWVCDYNRVTLSEIARGAPSPTRGRAAEAQAGIASGWAIVERIGVSAPGAALPNVIPNATLNRFGPDTKAAVLLTAANRLLEPVTGAVRTATALLAAHDGAAPGDRGRLVVWAALVLEAFRSQPALVAAAIRARTVQRELLVDWTLPRAPSLDGLTLARCEVGSDPTVSMTDPLARPSTLGLLDATPTPTVCAEQGELADLMARELIEIGTLRSSGHLWLSQRSPGQLVTEALLPPTEVLGRFVDRCAPAAVDSPGLPGLPGVGDLAEHPPLVRRCVVLGALAHLRDLRFDLQGRERERARIVPLLREVGRLAERTLEADDPVRLVAACRIADMVLSTVRHDVRNDVAGPVAELQACVERCIEAQQVGTLDRGAAAEAVSSANVEINIVRRTNATRQEAGLPSPGELVSWLHRTWAAFGSLVEVGPQPPPQNARVDHRLPVGHHLHNYASFLASLTDDEQAQRAAVELFESAVLPARQQYQNHGRSSWPLRQSLQTASRASTSLAGYAAAHGDDEQAWRWAELGYGWIHRALAEPETWRLLDQPSEPAAHFALLAAPALLTALEAGVPEAGPSDVDVAIRLAGLAEAWAERVTDGDPARYVRAVEVTALRDRLRAQQSSGWSVARTPSSNSRSGPR